MKKTFSLLLFIFCSLFLCAEKFEYNEIFYNTINDSTAEVHFQTWWGFSGYQHDTIVIPPTVDYNGRTYRVVGIVQSAFIDFTSLVTVSIPNTVTTIGISAFANCTNLSKVLIPSSVQTIGSAAFAYCTSLKEVTCLAPIPPTCGELVLNDYEMFYGVDVSNIPLYVPTESIELYKNADHWKEFGTILPIDSIAVDKNRFPILSGLQRTGCTKTIGENGNGTTVWGSRSYLMQEIETATIDGKQYLLFGTNNIYDEYCSLWLREENNKILLYSTAQKKDLVLYDFTINVGDSLPRLYVDYDLSSVVDYDNDEWGLAPLVVTEVSTITLLDGKEYKKWTFDNGIEYVEEIGSFGSNYGHNDFYQLIVNAPLYSDVHSQHLVCVSKNGKLLYQMDDAELERLNIECLCDGYQSSYKDQWCDTWNVLYHGWDPEGGDDPYMPYTFIYQLEEDTTINDLTYQRLTGRFSLSTMPSNKEYVAALRFAENKKVFVHYDNTEYLLYDFGAQVGDTLEIFGGINHYKDFKTLPHVITEIDTLDDGRLQIHSEVIIQFYEGTESEHERLYPKIWIEGIGSKDGIVQNSATNRIGSGVTALLCAYRDEDCIYTTDNPYYTPYGCVHNDSFFTATEEVKLSTQSAQKIMYNGQLLILHDGKTYNIMGAEIQ